jgi:uncharacterized RDD family membrane protein YckC
MTGGVAAGVALGSLACLAALSLLFPYAGALLGHRLKRWIPRRWSGIGLIPDRRRGVGQVVADTMVVGTPLTLPSRLYHPAPPGWMGGEGDSEED